MLHYKFAGDEKTMTSNKPVTIDNIGIESYQRYAFDQKTLDKDFIQSSKQLAGKTEVSVTTPYPRSEFDDLFNLQKKSVSWAGFQPPQNYLAHTRSIFSFHILPNLGTVMDLQELKDKLLIKKDKEKKKKKNSILDLLDCIIELEENLSFIKSRREQYHKG